VKRARFFVLLLILCIVPHTRTSASTLPQFIPIDVFLTHNAAASTVDVTFSNTLSGLSAVTTLEGYPNPDTLLNDFQIAANGVVFSASDDGRPRLLVPSGQILDFDFLPQSTVPPLAFDWVLSEDGRSLAWAELSFADARWQAAIFTAQLDGTTLTALPSPPATSQPSLRVRLIAVSNDASTLLLDIDHPIATREPGQRFDTYTSVRLYRSSNRIYQPIAETVRCPCPVSAAENLAYVFLLERPIVGNGYAIQRWDTSTDTLRTIAAVDTIFQQGGHVQYDHDAGLALYTMTGLANREQSLDSALVAVDFLNGNQRIIRTGPPNSNLRVQSMATEAQTPFIVDLRSNTTFKFNLENNVLDPIAARIWLGTIAG
jgi:hypothetical protein